MRRTLTAAVAAVVVAMALLVPPASATEQARYPILPLGDSLTYGVGNGYDSYRENLWGRLESVGLSPDFVGICPTSDASWKCQERGDFGDYNHSGHSGWRVDELALRIEPIMNWYNPRSVLLLAGANDIAQNHDLPNLGERIAFVWYYYMEPVFSPSLSWPMDDNPFYAKTGPCA